tara:strand:+ start:446 stop:691 length:246 start_codon:yes stop_codon:yes gene_type:complete
MTRQKHDGEWTFSIYGDETGSYIELVDEYYGGIVLKGRTLRTMTPLRLLEEVCAIWMAFGNLGAPQLFPVVTPSFVGQVMG